MNEEDRQVYTFARNLILKRLRGSLTKATESATKAEQWARDFSESLVRLLHHLHFITTNTMNVGRFGVEVWERGTRNWQGRRSDSSSCV
jgi:hypothetical protein